MSDQFLMKDGLGETAVLRIASGMQAAWPAFDVKGFEQTALRGIRDLGLKQRVNHLVSALNQHLPDDFVKTADILRRAPNNWDFGDPTDPIRSFASWPVIDYAATYGLEHPEVSLDLLKHLTHMFSAEFAIRPFILRYPELCLAAFETWVDDSNHQVRRLVSEGSRPRLPWGMRLPPYCDDPTPLIPLLTRLNNDPSDYVRRSVANSLNDISKDNPDIAVEVCQYWLRGTQATNEVSADTKWIVRHAMRSLIKSGRADVFPLLGFTANPKLELGDVKLSSSKIKLGEALAFETQIHSKSKSTQHLAIDFVIHHRKANGSLSPKVFKWKEMDLKPGQSLAISKKHAIRKINTRAYYSGQHQLDIVINGKTYRNIAFDLNCELPPDTR